MNEISHPGLTLHLAERLDLVADQVGLALDGPRLDPFCADVVCVAGAGVQRWLAQRLSERLGASDLSSDGVCAGVAFPDLHRLCNEALAQAGGTDPRDDPWSADQLVWALLRSFALAAGQDWFAPVVAHLAHGDEARPGRRYQTARRLARLYRRWLLWRPDTLEQWLTTGDLWQARLWRLVVEQVDAPEPCQQRRRAVARLAQEAALVDLPPSLHAVAPGVVPPGVRDVVAAVARHRTVHVWLVVPDAAPAAAGRTSPVLVPTLSRVRTGEVEAWRRVASEVAVHRVDGSAAVRDGSSSGSLLSRVQESVRSGAYLQNAGDPADRSVRVHSSHGPERQVEVLRDVLVDLLHRDPALQPRDIVVCTPDLDTYAPLVRARCMLNLPDEAAPALHPAHRIRVDVSDRSLRDVNPVLDVLVRVLDLATSRAEVGELLDFCATTPVARRFGFDGADERLATMMRGAGMRWGIDVSTRARFGVSTAQNTWQAGLNRLLLGVTMSERGLPAVGLALPYDLLDSQDVPLLGSLAEVSGRLRAAADLFASPATPGEWARRLRTVLLGEPDETGEIVGGLVSVPATDAWQVAQAHAQLSAIAEAAGPDAAALSLGDIKALLQHRLQSRLSRSALLTGNLTVTSLDALPQVPHRAVVLLGLDEQQFPRSVVSDGDDPLGRSEGEPTSAAEDRQAFLDALMAAKDSFVVIYRGRDTRTNEPVPAPIPVRELTDAISILAPSASIIVEHRLQPFDLAGFVPGAPTTFDACAAADAAALRDGRAAGALPARDRWDVAGTPAAELPEGVSIDELIRFLRDPLGHFRNARLGLAKPWSQAVSDQIPLELSGLDGWAVKERLVALRLSGVDRTAAEVSERLRGAIPPGRLGTTALDRHSGSVDQLAARAIPLLAGEATDLDVSLELASGTTLSGRVRAHGGSVILPVTGYPKGKHFVELWVRLLAASAWAPEVARGGVLVTDRMVVRLWPPADPVPLLERLIEVYRAGLSTVVLLPPNTAWSTACDQASAGSGDREGRREWRFEHAAWKGYCSESYDDLMTALGHDGKPLFLPLVRDLYLPIVTARTRPRSQVG